MALGLDIAARLAHKCAPTLAFKVPESLTLLEGYLLAISLALATRAVPRTAPPLVAAAPAFELHQGADRPPFIKQDVIIK